MMCEHIYCTEEIIKPYAQNYCTQSCYDKQKHLDRKEMIKESMQGPREKIVFRIPNFSAPWLQKLWDNKTTQRSTT